MQGNKATMQQGSTAAEWARQGRPVAGGIGDGPATLDAVMKGIEGIGGRLEGLEKRIEGIEEARKEEAEHIVGRAKELRGDMDKLADESRKRFQLMQQNVVTNGRYNGILASAEQARGLGLRVLHLATQGEAKWAMDKLREMDVWPGYEKAMGTTPDTGIGFLAPDDIAGELIRNVETFGVFRNLARRVPLGSDRKPWPRRTGGFTVYYPGEGNPITTSDLAIDQVNLEAIKYAMLTVFSTEIEEDSVIALGEMIALEAAQAFAEAEDDNGFNGDGTSTFARVVGILNSTNAQVEQFASGKTAFADLTYDHLVDIQAQGKGYVTNPQWMMSRTVLAIVRKMKDSNGNPIIDTSPLLVGEPATLLGDPIHRVNKMPKASDTAVSKALLAHGDLGISHYFGTRREIRIERSDHIRFDNDQVTIKVTQRVGIAERQAEAITLAKTAAS